MKPAKYGSKEHHKRISEALKKHHNTNWIAAAIKHPGSLHKALHVPEGRKIPLSLEKKAAKSPNMALRKEARLALTLRSFKK